MCGRFYADETLISEIWSVVRDGDRKRRQPVVGEIRPSEASLVLYGTEKHVLGVEVMQWGFRQISGSGLIINARSESVTDKAMFRDSIWQRRCVIPASWFYEWNQRKERVTFKKSDASVLYMAGFYQRYEEGNRFVILTTDANDSMKSVHDRMPVILEKQELESWIFDDDFMRHVLRRVPAELVKEQEYEQQSFVF